MKFVGLNAVFIFLLVSAVNTSAQESSKSLIKLSQKDKSKIIRHVLEDGLEKLFNDNSFNQCLTPIIDDNKVIFLQTDLGKDLIPREFKNYRLMRMTYFQINQEVLKNNGECYFKLDGFQMIGSKVTISLNRFIDEIYRFKNSDKYTRWMSGEGLHYEFEKMNKDWRIASSAKVLFSS